MAVGPRATKFWGVFRQSLVALMVDVGGLVAGVIVGSNLDLVGMAPWTIMLYPAIVSMRGTIGGVFSGHFSTGLHLGTMQPRLLRNTVRFNDLIVTVLSLNIIACAMLWIIAFFILTAIGTDPVPMLILLVGTTGLSFLAITPASTKIISFGFRRGLDPDVSCYPIESTVADVAVTVCYIVLLRLYVELGQVGLLAITVLDVVYVAVVVILGIPRMSKPEFVTTVKESAAALSVSSFLVNVTGVLLIYVTEVIKRANLIYMVYPALIDTAGDVGAIVGSMLTTKFHLGELRPSPRSMKQISPEIRGSWLASLVMFEGYGFFAWLTFASSELSVLPKVFLVLFTTNIMAVSAVVLVAFATGVLTYTKGLNPDSFIIPIESALADSLTTLSLYLSIRFLAIV
jgi:mgtE-like transporter